MSSWGGSCESYHLSTCRDGVDCPIAYSGCTCMHACVPVCLRACVCR